jgi:anti-sigma-K factor RskA
VKQDQRTLQGDRTLSHDKPTEEIREIAALFSLGALTQHEAASFEAHIRKGCPVCEAEYYKFKHITAEIGLAVNEADAPDYIRELILARIERETPEEAPAAESEEEETVAAAPPEGSSRPILTHPPGRQRSIFPWILVVLFAIAAGAVFYFYYLEQAESDRLKTELDGAQSQIKSLETSLNSRKDGPEELDQIISVVSKPETRIFHLAGLGPAPEASGAILWDVQQNKCLVFGYIPPPPQGKNYQLWYLTPSVNIPSGIVQPDSTGRIYDWFTISEDISSLTMAISLEPEGGSKTPTLPYYAIGRND